MRAPKGVIKKNVDPKLIVDDAAYSSRSVMVAIGVPAMGCTQPIFAPAGAKINGKQYKEMIEQSYFPQMSAIAQLYGMGRLMSFQQDNAPSHKTRDVLGSIKKTYPWIFFTLARLFTGPSCIGLFYVGRIRRFFAKYGKYAKNCGGIALRHFLGSKTTRPSYVKFLYPQPN